MNSCLRYYGFSSAARFNGRTSNLPLFASWASCKRHEEFMSGLGRSNNWKNFPQQQQQTRSMSKYMSKAARKRMPLTTKKAKKGGFYKGKRSTREGYLTSTAKFVVQKLRRVQLVIPDLTGFKVCVGVCCCQKKHDVYNLCITAIHGVHCGHIL